MRERWLVEFDGAAVEVESWEEAARLFLEAVEKGAKRVKLRRVVEYTLLEKLGQLAARLAARFGSFSGT